MSHLPKTILTIAGSDPVAGAGIQADLKTAEAVGAYAMTAITAVTAQNSMGVKGFKAIDPDLLLCQMECIVADRRPDAVKIGMIPSVESATTIADFLLKMRFENLVVDPVMVATSGDSLSSVEIITTFLGRIGGLHPILTPNIPEAEVLLGETIADNDRLVKASRELLERYDCRAVLLKGGHTPDDSDGGLCDLLTYRSQGKLQVRNFVHPRIITPNTHGTGCTLSSAMASYLALGLELEDAVGDAIEYLLKVIIAGRDYSWAPGGNGPMKHSLNSSSPSMDQRMVRRL